MTEAYWMQPDFNERMNGLDLPESILERTEEVTDNQPLIVSEPTPEWYWYDATDEALVLNVHQSYAAIGAAACVGGLLYRHPENYLPAPDHSMFEISTSLGTPQWTQFSLAYDKIFTTLDDDNFYESNADAENATIELQSIVNMVGWHRFDTEEQTTQLVAPYWGSITLGGQLSAAAVEYIKLHAGDTEHTVHYQPGTRIMQLIGARIFDDITPESGVGVMADGRFVSNTAAAMFSGSLEVLPLSHYRDERGLQYTSHNLDSATTRLWAFAGVAKIIGDAHRHYAELAKD
ncbi:MAG: hypothetical protein JWO35_279 [Candidatus Saccharibacteria bacterium]|nr:hypothetical protein [Candidatus Saccharibacteria bacterium]